VAAQLNILICCCILLLVVGCQAQSQEVKVFTGNASFKCGANYYEYASGECCPDLNNNNVCDNHETVTVSPEPEANITLAPGVVPKTKTVVVFPATINRVIINSENWHDVYSGMLFANLKGVPSNFLVNAKHGDILTYSIPTSETNILVLAGDRTQFVNYGKFLQERGYSRTNELVLSDVNLELARQLTTKKFIVVDPTYGYDAISAAPYAVETDSYVLFANKQNLADITSFLKERGVSSLIIFGGVDESVKASFSEFKPELIEKGDRFSNNLEMVNRYVQLNQRTEAILTSGEFIEAGLMNGADPVIFLSKDGVPDVVRDYIPKSGIENCILVGNELLGPATTVRKELGVSVFVKFAQGARTPNGSITQVEDYDRFPLPIID